LANRSHEVALRHDARDLAVISLDDNAADAMLLEQLCDIEQRLVFGSGDDTPTFQLQNCRDVHLVPPARPLIDNATAYLFEAEFVSAGLARVVNPIPAMFIHANARPDVLASTLRTLNGPPQPGGCAKSTLRLSASGEAFPLV
jgi:hypothetical protein